MPGYSAYCASKAGLLGLTRSLAAELAQDKILVNALCHCEEFMFSVSSHPSPHCTPIHWRHHATNSAVEIKDIEVDVFQWRAAADSRESVHVEILNPNWEFAGWIDKSLNLPEVVEISSVLNFRGTPTIYIRVTPWRIKNGIIEVKQTELFGNIYVRSKNI